MSFEESIIRNAAPTLACLKVANLYNFQFDDLISCNKTINEISETLNPKGIYIELLKNENNFYLIYVYRKTYLINELNKKEIKKFLEDFGYNDYDNYKQYIYKLKERINSENTFPHEIGVFLGYPLEDIKAFIKNRGRGHIICGEWKVYQNEKTACEMFYKLNHCKEIYIKVYENGRQLNDMVVGE